MIFPVIFPPGAGVLDPKLADPTRQFFAVPEK
jgi:hypothetical protein